MYKFSKHRHTGNNQRSSGYNEYKSRILQRVSYGRSAAIKVAFTCMFTFSSLFMTIECSTTDPDGITDGTLAQLMV